MIVHEKSKQAQIEPELYTLLGNVADFYEKASDLASDIVEKMARKILTDHNELDEFIMAMGSYFFTYKEGGVDLQPITQKMNKSFSYYYEDSEPYLKPLNDFIGEWDKRLKITGDAMRFTAKGQKITDW